MKKFLSALCAATIAAGTVVTVPAQAGPVAIQPSAERATDIQDVQYRRHGGRGFYRHGGHPYYNGYRGYRDYRHGYRRHNDYWFPAGAFLAGALIGGALAAPSAPPVYNSPRYYDGPRVVRRLSNAHINWCYDRYRSYRVSDNSFQPYSGPRQQCYSPY